MCVLYSGPPFLSHSRGWGEPVHYSELYPELVKIQLSLNKNWSSPSGGRVHVRTFNDMPSDHGLCGQSSGREVGSVVRVGSDVPERKSLLEFFNSWVESNWSCSPHYLPSKKNRCLVSSVSLQHLSAGSVCSLHKCLWSWYPPVLTNLNKNSIIGNFKGILFFSAALPASDAHASSLYTLNVI